MSDVAPSTPDAGESKSKVDEFKERFADWRLRRRRAGQAKKKSPGRRTTILLLLVVVLLFTAFFSSLRFLTPEPKGSEISLSQLIALSKAGRLDTAFFQDEDNLITGHFAAPLPTPEPAPTDKKNDGGKKSEGK